MRNTTNKLFTIGVMLFLSCTSSFAQSEFYPCKIVIKSDTTDYLIKHNFLKKPHNASLIESNSGEAIQMDLGLADAILLADDRFVVRKVAVPTNSDSFSRLDNSFGPQIMDSTLILRVLYSGSRSLYETSINNSHLFYIEEGGQLELLIFKRYTSRSVGSSKRLGSNSTYINQLVEYLSMSDKLKSVEIARLRYSRKSISSLYEKYYNRETSEPMYQSNRRNTIYSYLTSGYSSMKLFHGTYNIPSIGYGVEIMGRAPRNHAFYNEINLGYSNLTTKYEYAYRRGFDPIYLVTQNRIQKISLTFSHLYKNYKLKGKAKFLFGGGASYLIGRDRVENSVTVKKSLEDPNAIPSISSKIYVRDVFLTGLLGIGLGRAFFEGRYHFGILSAGEYTGFSLNLGYRIN